MNIYGGDGNDAMKAVSPATICPATSNDTINGGVGQRRSHRRVGDDTLQGGPDSDKLVGDAGADKLEGGTGDDVFYSSYYVDGNDTYVGGDGLNDEVTYAARGTAGLELSLDGIANDGQPAYGSDTISAGAEPTT